MEGKKDLMSLIANFPACDLDEDKFQAWKLVWQEAINVDKELSELRAWKAKARPFLEDQYYAFKNELECEGEFMLSPETKAEYEVWFKLLTELLGGNDDTR
jgi:hypothetical protein